MSDEFPPHDDLTPIRAHHIVDPKEATTRRFKCPACGVMVECPCPPALEVDRGTSALQAKIKDIEVYPFPVGEETKIITKPD